MKRYSIISAVIVMMYLILIGGMPVAEPLDSKPITQSDNLKSESAGPKSLQHKKGSTFIKEEDTIKKIFPPKKTDIIPAPEDSGEGRDDEAEPKELYEDDYYEEKPASIRPFSGGGGSLLRRSLPPPPSVLPPVTKKDPDIIEPGEVVIISADMGKAKTIAQQSADMGFSIKRRRILPGMGLVISVLRVSEGMTVTEAITTLRENFPSLWIDANHRYQLQSGEQEGVERYGHKLIGWEPTSNNCGTGLYIGLVDTMVDTNHPALKGQRLVARSFLTHGVKSAPMNHGTAVAGRCS